MQDQNDYGASGFDKFLSRGDSQSLQGSLDQEANVSNNAVPFDRTQVSGAPGDTYRVGNVFIDGVNGQIYVQDDNTNKRIILGTQSDGSAGLTISKEGKDADVNRSKDLLFNSKLDLFQVATSDSYTFPSLTIPPSTTQFQQFSVPIPAGLSGVPGYLAYTQFFPVPGLQLYSGFPASYFTQIFNNITFGDYVNVNIGHTIVIGIDNKKLYINQSTNNGDVSNTITSTPVTIKYYIYEQTITS